MADAIHTRRHTACVYMASAHPTSRGVKQTNPRVSVIKQLYGDAAKPETLNAQSTVVGLYSLTDYTSLLIFR